MLTRTLVVSLLSLSLTKSPYSAVFVVQDGRDDLSEVSAAGYTAVQRQQDSAARSAATKTGGGELTVQFIHPSNWRITPEWLYEAPREASSGLGVEYTK